jgi:hypothetical protein
MAKYKKRRLTMSIKIKIKADPPPALIRIIEEEYSPISTIKSILIDTYILELEKNESTGAFNPDTGEVLIDLGNCLKSKRWINIGMMVLPSVWFNMLHAVYHEAAHANQLKEDPKLLKLDHLPEIKEHAADLEAHDKIYEWSEKGIMPKLNEMGWAGKKLKDLINMFYSDTTTRTHLLEEVSILECNGVAEVNNFISSRKDSFNKASYETLCEAIDKGEFGIKINSKRYLHADEFFAAD